MISPTREAELRRLARLCLEARRTAAPISEVPSALIPVSSEEVWFVQDIMSVTLEPKGTVAAHAWKIGAPAPDATPNFGPMITDWIVPSGSVLSGRRFRLRGLEAEVAFKIGKALPPRVLHYTREEIIDAIESCHPVIEELESAMPIPAEAPKLVTQADLGIHGGFIYGPAVENWQQIDFAQERVTLSLDGVVEVDRTASNSAGTDLLRMVIYLANEGAARTGGLEAGTWVTTGSWTGNTFAKPGQKAEISFTHVGSANVSFA